jgi:hypothetical protein
MQPMVQAYEVSNSLTVFIKLKKNRQIMKQH